MKTTRGRDLVRKELRRERGLESSANRLLVKQQAHRDVMESLNTWKIVHPKISSVNAKMTSLLKETEDLVNLIDEPIYIIEVSKTGDIKLCRKRDLTVVR